MERPPFGIENALTYLIMRSGRVMVKSLRSRFSELYPEIPVEHWGILVHLWKKDGQSQQELADMLCKDKATITRALAILEKLNVVVKIPDEKDRRHKKIYLTPQGQELKHKLVPLVEAFIGEVTKGIPVAEIEICKSVLNKIYQNANH